MLETLNQAPAIALSARLSGSLTTALERSLQVNLNSVRQQAARCIVHFNLREAVPLLRRAAKNEKDLATKRALEQAEHDLVHGI